VKTWLNAIANNAWQVVVMGAHNQLNTVWDSQVMSTYNSAIQDRYPISESDSQIAIDDFNQFFGTGGVVDAYFNNYIKPFVNTSGSTWQLLSVDGHDLEIPAGNLALFQQAQTIRNEFFPNNAKQANLNFSIKPLTLDNNASSIQLSLGNQSLTYSHGPQFPMAVNWPLPFNNQLAQALINTFDGNQYGRTASGPWGLFKLFSYGNLTQTTSSGNYELDLNFNGVSASFSIAGSAGINVYRLTDLSGFSLPETIAPNANQ
jgi:type VI secretion system protein ImpL